MNIFREQVIENRGNLQPHGMLNLEVAVQFRHPYSFSGYELDGGSSNIPVEYGMMKNLPLSYVHVKELNKALGKQIAAFDSQDSLENFLVDVCEPLTASRKQPFEIDDVVFARLFASLKNKAPSEFKSTQRIELIASAFGWSGDAFMHKLKTDFAEREERAWQQVRDIYASHYGDMSAFVEALKDGKGLIVCASATGAGKSTFVALTDILIRDMFRHADRKMASNSALSASYGSEILRSKYAAMAGLFDLNFGSVVVDWPARSREETLLAYFDLAFEDQIKETFEEARHRLVIATTHASNIQGALHRLNYAAGEAFAPKRLLACVSLQLVYRDEDSPKPSRSVELEVVRFQTQNQVNAVLEEGTRTGLYARAFGNKASREDKGAVFAAAAKALGWRFSHALGGYIHESHRNRPGEDPNGWGSYEVADDAEEACFWEGIETLGQAIAKIQELEGEKMQKIETRPYGHEPESMEREDFVRLANEILAAKGSPYGVGMQYEDDYITIRSNYNGLNLEVSRKPFVDPENPHLRVPNPTTMVARTGEIIRHHGEHVYITGHLKALAEPEAFPSMK